MLIKPKKVTLTIVTKNHIKLTDDNQLPWVIRFDIAKFLEMNRYKRIVYNCDSHKDLLIISNLLHTVINPNHYPNLTIKPTIKVNRVEGHEYLNVNTDREFSKIDYNYQIVIEKP